MRANGGRWMTGAMAALLIVGAGQAVKAAPAPDQVIGMLAKKAAATKSYSFEWTYDGRSKNGKTHQGEQYKLEFLSPNFRKMTIVKRDAFSNGAVVIYNPNVNKDEVVGKKFMIRRTYKTGDPEIGGYFDTDLASISKKIAAQFKGAKGALVKEATLDGKKTYLLTFTPIGKLFTKVNLWLDVKDSMPRKIEFFDKKGLEDRRHYTAYAFPKLDPSVFVH